MRKADNRDKTLDYEVILLAAGQGKRMGASRNKILLHLIGKPVISYSLQTFLNDPACKHIILVTQEDEQQLLATMVKKKRKEINVLSQSYRVDASANTVFIMD
ncbi:2-C-methyl-D-erythritol 4-phosphate cytidylyltransferase [Enterococcus termitis]